MEQNREGPESIILDFIEGRRGDPARKFPWMNNRIQSVMDMFQTFYSLLP